MFSVARHGSENVTDVNSLKFSLQPQEDCSPTIWILILQIRRLRPRETEAACPRSQSSCAVVLGLQAKPQSQRPSLSPRLKATSCHRHTSLTVSSSSELWALWALSGCFIYHCIPQARPDSWHIVGKFVEWLYESVSDISLLSLKFSCICFLT